MLPVSLPVNSRLVVVRFGGVKSYMQIFDHTGVGTLNPQVVQGPTVY